MNESTTKAVLVHVAEEMKKVKYGKITIELRETSDKIDVITETRHRFDKNPS